MYQENVVLCGASAYEQKYYFNKDFDSLPDHVKKEFSHWNLMITETCSLKQRLRKLMDFMMILAVH